jgi:hypothetical protein
MQKKTENERKVIIDIWLKKNLSGENKDICTSAVL